MDVLRVEHSLPGKRFGEAVKDGDGVRKHGAGERKMAAELAHPANNVIPADRRNAGLRYFGDTALFALRVVE